LKAPTNRNITGIERIQISKHENPDRAVHFQHGLFDNVGTVTEIIILFEAKQAALFFSRPFNHNAKIL